MAHGGLEMKTVSLLGLLGLSLLAVSCNVSPFSSGPGKTLTAALMTANEGKYSEADEYRRVVFRSDRKSTRLNSRHPLISYAVFCFEKKRTNLNSSHLVISYSAFCLVTKRKRLT